MEEQLRADRQHLWTLLTSRPDWSVPDLAAATGRSPAWVKKWRKRLLQAAPDDLNLLRSRSRARLHPPASLSPIVIDRILEIRDHPPHNLNRIPGPKAICYFLEQEATTRLASLRLPRSTRTIWRILHQHQRICAPPERSHTPTLRPAPLSHWQIDFKDASSVPPKPEGKQQHVVEVLNVIDVGTSILLSPNVRSDFSMATAISALAQLVRERGLPDLITIDRDPRFVGSSTVRDCPVAFLRLWYCLGVAVEICPPRRPDINGFVERYHRTYNQECLQLHRPADQDTLSCVTASFEQHYNYERPHQGQSCRNQPPCVAFPDRAARPPIPLMVDPDRWVDVLSGKRFVRKVQADTSVQLDLQRYYTKRELVGKYVTLQIEASSRTLVIEQGGQAIKRVPIRGTSNQRLPFAEFVERLCDEARTGRLPDGKVARQLALPF
jgi:transposase InsO family protein